MGRSVPSLTSFRTSTQSTNKKRRLNLRPLAASVLAVPLASILGGSAASAATKFWDINGSGGGAGGATPAGTWDTATTSNWSTDSQGTIATTTWAASDAAIFSAGNDATGSYTITIPT